MPTAFQLSQQFVFQTSSKEQSILLPWVRTVALSLASMTEEEFLHVERCAPQLLALERLRFESPPAHPMMYQAHALVHRMSECLMRVVRARLVPTESMDRTNDDEEGGDQDSFVEQGSDAEEEGNPNYNVAPRGFTCLDMNDFSQNHSLMVQLSGLLTTSPFMPPEKLVALRVAGCAITEELLLPLATKFGDFLEELDVEGCVMMTQAAVDQFVHLRVLNVSQCGMVKDVSFCGKTLEVLHINGPSGVRDDSLASLYRLRSLHCNHNPAVTTVAPFAQTLRLLSACGSTCGVSDEGLRDASNIQALYIFENTKVTTVRPFARQLRQLRAYGLDCMLGDAGLSDATSLVSLVVSTTIRPFASTLRELIACGLSGITEDELAEGGQGLVRLTTTSNSRIQSRDVKQLRARYGAKWSDASSLPQ